MSDTNFHKYPWGQLLLYEYNLNPMEETKLEWWDRVGNDVSYRFANLFTPMNIIVQFDPDLIPP